MSHYCCKKCGLRYDDCQCISTLEPKTSDRRITDGKSMKKEKVMYIVTYTESEQVYQPPYNSNERGGYESTPVSKYALVDSADALYEYRDMKDVKYFSASEVFPKFKVQVLVDL